MIAVPATEAKAGSLGGLASAEKAAYAAVSANPALKESAEWAGCVTLKDGRVADVGVFYRIREQDAPKPRKRVI